MFGRQVHGQAWELLAAASTKSWIMLTRSDSKTKTTNSCVTIAAPTPAVVVCFKAKERECVHGCSHTCSVGQVRVRVRVRARVCVRVCLNDPAAGAFWYCTETIAARLEWIVKVHIMTNYTFISWLD